MKKLYVYADFDWLKDIELIGELGYESILDIDSYSFKFAESWILKYNAINLSDDLNNHPSVQYTQPHKGIFRCFTDVLPDKWGHTLLLHHEQILALEKNKPIHHLSSFDFLTDIDDFFRIGGFRFKETPDGEFINTEKSFRIPPLTDLWELITASKKIEKSEEANSLPEKRWITQLVQSASSLGGKRPKSNIVDTDRSIYVAKFPSLKDDYDVELWEHFCHLLAKNAGINAAETMVIATNNKNHTLLSRRFDRTDDGKRIHFASAMTLLDLNDENDTTQNSYLDIVDFILSNCIDVDTNLRELFRRVAFNICIGNSDDHFRNHGFLLTSKGWTLSPAFDMNPTSNNHQSLLINNNTNKSDLSILFNSCKEYMLTPEVAKEIINDVVEAVKNWQTLANKLGIAKCEINLFKKVFDNNIQLS